ncbi:hypothetical protein [Actinomadura sediminis]|uniref:Helix-hairpin-helix domain-containing protein n=1 Tax=Actinomadura sediminis TaxID=1038904 RepID=A0ABW3EZ57_9ACTN
MTTSAQLRKTALSLPETAEERTSTGTTAFTVGGRRFASTAGNEVHLHLPRAEAQQFLTAYPGARQSAAGVGVPLDDVDGQRLNHWVRRAWLSQAPERLAAQAAAADTATAGDVGDLPKAIGRPATRALTAAGVTTLAQVAELTEGELRAMHGVGPKAVGVLRATLAADGRSFKEAP